MTGFRIKQIGLVICLMASLAVGSTAACLCSHHQEKSEKAETSCHGDHEAPVEKVEAPSTGDALDGSCVCFVNQPNPVLTSKSESKKNKSEKNAPAADQAVPTLEALESRTLLRLLLPRFERLLSCSDVLKRLLPSRAPPRL